MIKNWAFVSNGEGNQSHFSYVLVIPRGGGEGIKVVNFPFSLPFRAEGGKNILGDPNVKKKFGEKP